MIPSLGLFLWLMNIRPGYMVLTLNNNIIIEPYMPSCFARQSCYDQLYVGNPNLGLQPGGRLLDTARAWFYNVNGCTGTKF